MSCFDATCSHKMSSSFWVVQNIWHVLTALCSIMDDFIQLWYYVAVYSEQSEVHKDCTETWRMDLRRWVGMKWRSFTNTSHDCFWRQHFVNEVILRLLHFLSTLYANQCHCWMPVINLNSWIKYSPDCSATICTTAFSINAHNTIHMH